MKKDGEQNSPWKTKNKYADSFIFYHIDKS